MTLFRQLFLGTSLLFLGVLAGIQWLYVNLGREALERQLAATAQDAATSIALSLGARGRIDDPALVEVTLSPVFDRGYYSRIAVATTRGEVRADRTLELERPDAPSWFVRILPVAAPTARAIISSGWSQLGQVEVTAHPHFLYRQLWDTTRHTAAWLFVAYLLALAALRAFLVTLLKPLSDVERAAAAIGRREFPQITTRARSIEIQRVVDSFNVLSGKIRTLIADEAAEAARVKHAADADGLTGLYTRDAFERAYANLAIEEGEVHSVLFAVWHVADLKHINDVHGRVRADAVLVVCADALRQVATAAGCLYARLSGAEFVIAAVNQDEATARQLMTDIGAAMKRRIASLFFSADATAVGGACYRASGPFPFSELLSVADEAVRKARLDAAADYAFVTDAADERVARGNRDWRETLQTALAAGRFVLYGQRVFALPDEGVLHTELFTRMLDEHGREIEAGRFIPMMSRHGLLAEFDVAAIAKAIAYAERDPRHGDYAINVSAQTIESGAYRQRILQALAASTGTAARIVFEMTEFGVAANVQAAIDFSAAVRHAGAHFAIDHFSLERTVLAHLPALLPRYLKLAPGLVGLSDGQFLIGTLKRMAQPLEVQLIGQGDHVLALARRERLDGYQSFEADRPHRLD